MSSVRFPPLTPGGISSRPLVTPTLLIMHHGGRGYESAADIARGETTGDPTADAALLMVASTCYQRLRQADRRAPQVGAAAGDARRGMRVNAKRLREARKRRSSSQTELGRLAGTSVSHVFPRPPCNPVRLTLQPMRGKNRSESTATESRAPKSYFQYGLDKIEGVFWLPADWLADPSRAPRTIELDVPGLHLGS